MGKDHARPKVPADAVESGNEGAKQVDCLARPPYEI